MTLVRYEPWKHLDRLHHEVNRLFNESLAQDGDDASRVVTSAWHPAVDIRETDDAYLVHADIPGVDPAAIEITVEAGMLTVRGERSGEERTEAQGYRRVERHQGTFYRRFSLPDDADVDKVSAKGNHGVLEIRIPKTARATSRRIQVEH